MGHNLCINKTRNISFPVFPSTDLIIYFLSINNIMGSTDSRSGGLRLDQDYRLVRRFISDFYSGEITVV